MLRYANGIHDYVRDPDKQDRELVRNTYTHTSILLPKPEIMAECVSGSQQSIFVVNSPHIHTSTHVVQLLNPHVGLCSKPYRY